uniref:Uncharacterized protein n=1 Tax=Meloidogyne enterolobii TaxID=390850 RepID=A0A6V7UN86_MELEN|nr:unnamed protein product [Meloidogyne enterolobii]
MEPIVTGEVYTINVGWTKCLTNSLFHPKPDETVLNSRDKVVIYCQVFCRKRGIAFPDMTPNFELDPDEFIEGPSAGLSFVIALWSSILNKRPLTGYLF